MGGSSGGREPVKPVVDLAHAEDRAEREPSERGYGPDIEPDPTRSWLDRIADRWWHLKNRLAEYRSFLVALVGSIMIFGPMAVAAVLAVSMKLTHQTLSWPALAGMSIFGAGVFGVIVTFRMLIGVHRARHQRAGQRDRQIQKAKRTYQQRRLATGTSRAKARARKNRAKRKRNMRGADLRRGHGS